jgi:alanine racemase
MSAAPEPSGVRRVARLSARTFDEALTALTTEYGEAAEVDLRADAYGHGAIEVERRARSRGVVRFIRDADAAPAVDRTWALYGFDLDRPPLLSLTGEVVAVKRVAADTAVSYGYTYRTAAPSTLALVGLGYADGVPRSASSTATVRVGGHRGLIAGRIAMDQLVVDLGDASADVGDDAVLWDDAESFGAWCAATGRAPAELTTRLGARIRRVWSDA